jgi:hypothetical protein
MIFQPALIRLAFVFTGGIMRRVQQLAGAAWAYYFFRNGDALK